MHASPFPPLNCGLLPLELERDDTGPLRAMLAYAFGSCAGHEATLRACLSPVEEAVAARYSHPRRLQSYLLGRSCAKRALSPLLGEADLRTIEIVSGVFDQPLVRYPGRERFDVSLTHWDGGALALAFPDGHPMGIDGEAPDPGRLATMAAQLTPEESRWCAPSPLIRTTVAWTAREALSKALRCGLMVPLEFLATTPPQGEGSFWEGRYAHFAQYRFLSVAAPGAVMTVALPRQSRFLDFNQWVPPLLQIQGISL